MSSAIPVIIGMILRIPILLIQGKRLNVKTFKLPILAVVFTLFELFGTMVLYVIENGAIGGMSYYGGILLMPIFAILLSLVFRIKYLDTMDLFATVAGAMVVMRVQCILTGCCGGKVLFTYKGTDIRFPNRIIEIITVLVLTIILLNLGKKVKYKGLLYPIYMISYGIVRFIINWFREGVTPFVWVLPAGNFWSLIAIAVNVLWIIVVIKNRKKLVTEDCNYIS
jgi:prolipoprotein diacylglyceryltransferase